MAVSTSGTGTRVRVGRRVSPALTAHRIKAICAKVETGVPQQAAAMSLGIPKRTFQNWLAAGRAEGADGLYAELAEKLDQAIARFHNARAVAVIAHAEKDPRSAMFILERRFPDEWADQTKRGGDVNIHVTLEVERRELAERMLNAAVDVLGDDPDLLERFVARLSAGDVVEGEVVEVAELEP